LPPGPQRKPDHPPEVADRGEFVEATADMVPSRRRVAPRHARLLPTEVAAFTLIVVDKSYCRLAVASPEAQHVSAGVSAMLDTEALRAMARDYTVQAREATDSAIKARLIGLAQSYLLLAKNAEWIHSTDKFMHAVKNGDRWPHPTVNTERALPPV
jgi:hypothetical protein